MVSPQRCDYRDRWRHLCCDWYDPVVGGHQMEDSIGYGRIYRIAPKNKKLTAPDIDTNTMEGQIEALKNPAINVRNSGFQKIIEQGSGSIAAS